MGKPKGYVWFRDVMSNVLTSLVTLYLAIGKSRLHVRTFCIVIVLVVVAGSFIIYPSGALFLQSLNVHSKLTVIEPSIIPYCLRFVNCVKTRMFAHSINSDPRSGLMLVSTHLVSHGTDVWC